MTDPAGSSGRAPAAQLPLALRYPSDQRFETFVSRTATWSASRDRALRDGHRDSDQTHASASASCVADAAGDADTSVAQVRALAGSRAPGGGATAGLYLVGPPGVGKTHLALAACAWVHDDGRRSAYLPLASAAGRVRDALDALHDNDLIALDGLDAVAGNRDDAIALFDFHNRVHDAGHALLYAARCPPDELPLALPDLRSRLSQCARIALSPLDDAGRRRLLRLRAERRGLAIDDAAIDWLLARVDRDLATLTAWLDRLDQASLAAQRRVTVPFLRQLLGGDAI
ncbi:MAG: DnaA regulatory inactivator Hda [Luteimonas sp.]